MQKTILYICIFIVLISFFFVLIPNKNMESTIKFIFNLFLITIIIVPLISAIKKIDLTKYNDILNKNNLYIKNLDNSVLQSNIKNLETALKTVFLQNGYKDLDISININKENKTTNISITIPEEKNYNKNEVEKIVKQQTGITPKIISR